MNCVFITNVTQYTGPGIVSVLSQKGYSLICHDPSFVEDSVRQEYETKHKVVCLSAQNPEEIVQKLGRIGSVERFVFNDAHPNTPKAYEKIHVEEMRNAFDALVEFPFQLSTRIVPQLKSIQRGHVLFITSARQLQPEAGFTVATTVRSAATALALSLAREVAEYGIQVNVLQPNYLYSELYYPKAHFIESEAGRDEIKAKVPMGRLGDPEEIGELAELFISGRSAFTTGQVINFTGGWP